MGSSTMISKEHRNVQILKEFESQSKKRENDPGWDLSCHDFETARRILWLAVDTGELQHDLQAICFMKKSYVRVAVMNLGTSNRTLEWGRLTGKKWDVKSDFFGQSASWQTISLKAAGKLTKIGPGEILEKELSLKSARLLTGRQRLFLEFKSQGKLLDQQCHLVNMPK